MGTGSITSEHVWREASSEATSSVDQRDVVVCEPSAPPLKHPDIDQDRILAAQTSRPAAAMTQPGPATDLNLAAPSIFDAQVAALVSAVRRSLKTKWFWYAIASSLCWTGWAFTAKIGSKEIPPATMEFISSFGFVLVSLGVLRRKSPASDKSSAGKCFALISGILLALGGISLYGAYRTGYNASMITAVTSLYPVVTVFCAIGFLREKLNKMQVVGLLFAVAAMFILSL
ncbi:MAG TPA: DMT family transporter [Terriglobales bacterium]|nr:DMT family transporter [Terriglobales bacterium]